VFKVFDSNGIYWVHCFDDFVYTIKNLVTSYLIEVLLVVEVEEVMDAGEEPLGVEVRQFRVSTYVIVPRDHGSK
jgi:hypothetical protein